MNVKLLPKLAIAALFAATTATAVVGHEAASPATTASGTQSALDGTSVAADAQGYPYYHRGFYPHHGRYWAHRRWHGGYYGPYHHWHPGFWVYF